MAYEYLESNRSWYNDLKAMGCKYSVKKKFEKVKKTFCKHLYTANINILKNMNLD